MSRKMGMVLAVGLLLLVGIEASAFLGNLPRCREWFLSQEPPVRELLQNLPGPAAAGGAAIGAAMLTFFGVMKTLDQNRRQHETVLNRDRENRKEDAALALRKETYFAACKAFSELHMFLANLHSEDNSLDGLTQKMDQFAGVAQTIQVIADIPVRKAVLEFGRIASVSAINLSHFKYSLNQTRILLKEAERRDRKLESRLDDFQRRTLEEKPIDQEIWQIYLQTIKDVSAEKSRLLKEQAMKVIEMSKASIEAQAPIGRQLANVVTAFRADLGLCTDKEWYLPEIEKQGKEAAELGGKVIADLEAKLRESGSG